MMDFLLQLLSFIRGMEKCISMPWKCTFSIFLVFMHPSAQTAHCINWTPFALNFLSSL